MALEVPRKRTALFNPFGVLSETDVLVLLGIRTMKYDEFLLCVFNICLPAYLVEVRPQLIASHLVHAFTNVPVNERLRLNMANEEMCGKLELFLNGRGRTQENNCPLQSLWRDNKDGCLVVVGNSFHEVR